MKTLLLIGGLLLLSACYTNDQLRLARCIARTTQFDQRMDWKTPPDKIETRCRETVATKPWTWNEEPYAPSAGMLCVTSHGSMGGTISCF